MSVTLINYLPGIGMLAVGIGAILLWFLLKGKKPAYFGYFVLGAIFWAIAIMPKYAMDYTITAGVESILVSSLPIMAVIIIVALYFGLRTGFFESGFTYLIIKYLGRYIGLTKMGFNEAVALGIGFGGFEAIFIGSQWFMGIGPLLMSPLDPTSYLGVWERLFTLFCHVFAVVLVVYAVKLNDHRWLWLSIAYKSVLDGSLILFLYFLGTGLNSTYIIEAFVAILGIAGLIGLYWIDKNYGGGAPDASKAGDPHSGD
jgi:uncharacterized membrane protein YhfC